MFENPILIRKIGLDVSLAEAMVELESRRGKTAKSPMISWSEWQANILYRR
jgi:hypothetical protein